MRRRPHWTEQRSIFDVLGTQATERVTDARVLAQASELRAKYNGHPSADHDCEGCSLFGLCAFHGPPATPGEPARTREQAIAWARGGYAVPDALAPKPEATVQDVAGDENEDEDEHE